MKALVNKYYSLVEESGMKSAEIDSLITELGFLSDIVKEREDKDTEYDRMQELTDDAKEESVETEED